ncbi:MAG: type II secretion system protein GspJ [Myxococcota bacterium]
MTRGVLGFTLIEVLISAGLLAMMGSLGMSVLHSSVQVKDAVQAQSQPYHMARQALQRMSREISMAYISAHGDPESPVVQTGFEGSTDKLSFTAFGHVVHRQNAHQSDQHKVAYFLGPDPQTGQQALLRSQIRDAKEFSRNEGKAQVLCKRVNKLRFEYWDERTKAWQSEWKSQVASSEWNLQNSGSAASGSKTALPKRVRIELSTHLGEKQELFLATQTGIWLHTQPIRMQ